MPFLWVYKDINGKNFKMGFVVFATDHLVKPVLNRHVTAANVPLTPEKI